MNQSNKELGDVEMGGGEFRVRPGRDQGVAMIERWKPGLFGYWSFVEVAVDPRGDTRAAMATATQKIEDHYGLEPIYFAAKESA